MIPKCVLLIDDDDDFTTLMELIFEKDPDWQIITAIKAKEGIFKAQLEQPDVILLDIMMPNLNGLDVYKILKSDLTTCTIPIIFVTSMTPLAEILEWQITEDVEVITKPFDILELPNQLNELYDSWSLSSN